MIRFFTWFLLCACAWLMAVDTPQAVEHDLQFFTSSHATKLKKGVKNTKKFQSKSMANLAQVMLKGQYKPDYLYAEYKALPMPNEYSDSLKIGNGFSRFDIVTGVYLPAGQHVVLVGKTQGQRLGLVLPNWMRKPPMGTEPTKDPKGWGLYSQYFPLHEGVNVIQVETPTNAYIDYYSHSPDQAPAIPVHFVTGLKNGYFDTTRGDTDKDWERLLSQSVSPVLDAKGQFIQVVYPVESLKKITQGRGVALINAYDKLLGIQYRLMGLDKYDKMPKNKVLSRVNFNYYMFRDNNGVAYLGDDWVMNMVANPDNVLKGDACWGFSHEVGHVMQMRPMTWGGMTEVSNNLFSLQAAKLTGNSSRLKQQHSYDKAHKEIVEGGISYHESKDVFNKLVPLWQLHLYFSNHDQSDFYPDLMEYLRQHAPNYQGNDTVKYSLEFAKACCAVGKTDLTDFFEKWGFFKPGQFHVQDYGNYDFTVTQEMVDSAKHWIAEQKFPKPTQDITLIRE